MPIKKAVIGGVRTLIASGPSANRFVWNIALKNRWPRISSKAFEVLTRGKVNAAQLRNRIAKNISEIVPLMGTVRRTLGRKGQFIAINRDAMRQNKVGLREIFQHERFHLRPIIGQSEIGAHFFGGALARKGGFSIKGGLSAVERLKLTRPKRFKLEAGIAAALGATTGITAAATTFIEETEKKTRRRVKKIKKRIPKKLGGDRFVFRRIKGRVVRIKVKHGA